VALLISLINKEFELMVYSEMRLILKAHFESQMSQEQLKEFNCNFSVPFPDDNDLVRFHYTISNRSMRVQALEESSFVFDSFISKNGFDKNIDDLCIFISTISDDILALLVQIVDNWFTKKIAIEDMEQALQIIEKRLNSSM